MRITWIKLRLLLTFILFSHFTRAQQILIGAFVPFSAKVNSVNRGTNFRPLFSTGLGCTVKIRGKSEKNLLLQVNTSLEMDKTNYNISQRVSFGINQKQLVLNPEINIPIAISENRLSVLCGWGLTLKLDQNYNLSSSSNSISSITLANFDSTVNYIDYNTRIITPFVGIGLNYQYNRHFSFNAFLRQNLTNRYQSETRVIILYNKQSQEIRLDYQPLFVGCKILYFLF